MFYVLERFKSDGKCFILHSSDDKFECEVWMNNNYDCSNALRIGNSELIIEER